MTTKAIAIIGAGGFAREVLMLVSDCGSANAVAAFYESDEIWRDRVVTGLPVWPISRMDPKSQVVIAIGAPKAREAMALALPSDTAFPRFVHPSAVISKSVEVGEGTLVCAGSILTCDIRVGAHVQLNLCTTVGHDCVLEDYVTTAPAVNISGNCRIGRGAYFGTNSCVREGLAISSYVSVGMGAVVVAALNEPAQVYVGNPARALVRR